MRWRGPYSTSGVISSPGWAGRQCSATACWVRAPQQLVAQAVRLQLAAALLCKGGVVVHAQPDVGVNGVGLAYRGAWIFDQHGGPRGFGERVGRRRGDADLDPGQGAEDRQRSRHVVAVADVGELQTGELAELLLERQQVRERLTGVVTRGEHVDHRDGRVAGELGHELVRAGADADGRDVTREHVCRVADDSPRLSWRSSLRSTMGCPASSAIPTSNETRVRVEGWSKIRATVRLRSRSEVSGARLSSVARSSSANSLRRVELCTL